MAKQALKLLGGSLLTYVIVAACSSSGSGGTDRTHVAAAGQLSDDSSNGGATAAGASAEGGGTTGAPNDAGMLDAVADALSDVVDPVPEADAQIPEPPTQTTVDCDARYLAGETATYRSYYVFAEAEYPGVPASELWNVTAVGEKKGELGPGDYTHTISTVQTKAGIAAIMCRMETEIIADGSIQVTYDAFSSVTFIR